MTNPDYTAICLLIDSSGSMDTIKDATEEGINSYIKEQAKEPGKRTIRINTFNAPGHTDRIGIYTFCDSIDIKDVDSFILHPAGATALLDAMGTTITEFGAELTAMTEEERPAHVVFVIMTDGLENSSDKYTWKEVFDMVRHQEEVYKWDFLYLGANQDAIHVGNTLGISYNRSATYDTNPIAVAAATATASSYTSSSARGLKTYVTDEQRRHMLGNK